MSIKFSLSSVLFSQTQQRVLALLYGHPDQSYSTNDIIRVVDSGRGAVQRELIKLASVGLITSLAIGNQKHYQVDQSAPIYNELRSIILKTSGLGDVLLAALQPVIMQIHSAFVYGSIAKQEDTASSDVDLMVLTDQLTYADLFPLLQNAEKTLQRTINPNCYSIAGWSKKLKNNNNFISQVMQQPKIFLVGTEDELKQLR